MIQIAICDDNPYDLNQLKTLVSTIEPMNYTIHAFLDPNDCLQTIKNGMLYDCFILDMLMENENGISIAKQLRKTHQSQPILFVTATQDFAIQGYEVNAFRYYMKPLDETQFLTDFSNVLHQIDSKKHLFITISNSDGLTKIKLSDIYYIESDLRTLLIHTKNDHYSLTGKISELEESLKNYDFVRVHKSFLVNLQYVKNIFKDIITLDNQETVLLSKHRSKSTHEKLMNYIKENI